MSGLSSKVFSRSMQTVMGTLAWLDDHWGNHVVELGEDGPTRSPYEHLLDMRSRGNILRSYTINGWFALAHEDVKLLFRDKRLSNEITNNKMLNLVIRSASRGLTVPMLDNPNMLNRDAPDHTRLRKLSAKSFTNRFIQSLAPTIGKLVDELLDQVPPDAEHFDVVADLAKHLPAIVIAEMLGVPVEERHLFERWSADLLGYAKILDPTALQAAVEGDLALRIYLEELTDYKRDNPGDDLISRMIEAEEDGDKLTLDELYSTCMIILVAGHETTTRLIGSCLYLLLTNPDQMDLVKSNRANFGNAIEETLRVEPPVQMVARMVGETFEYQGNRFKKGQLVMLSIAGANRDPDVFDEPESFRIERENLDHISFGHGIHLCLGMPLARLEAEIALNKIFDRFPNMEMLTDDVTWEVNPFFRGLEKLEIRVQRN